MNRIIPAILTAAIFHMCFSQINNSENPAHFTAMQHISLSSSFTDSSNYNSFDFAGNPLGRLDKDTNVLSLNAGFRLYNSPVNAQGDSGAKFNDFILPAISLRPSNGFLMSLNYSFNSVKTDSFSLPLHSFGLMMLGQSEKRIIQGGFTAQCIIGKEKSDNSDNTRSVMGLEDLGICIGSQITPNVNIGLYAHAAFYLDTLFNSDDSRLLQDRHASVKLPQFDLTSDINIPGIKDKASLKFTYAKEHFVYTEKTDDNSLIDEFHDIAGNNTTGDGEEIYGEWDADPIKSDSIAFGLQNRISFSLSDNVNLVPAIELGFTHKNSVRMKPGKDNHPFTYEGERSGFNWESGSFRFGIGSSLEILNMSDIWLEYSFSKVSLTTGDEYDESVRGSKSKNMGRFGIGTKFDFAQIPSLDIGNTTELALTIGYLYEQYNMLFSDASMCSAFEHINSMGVNTQLYRYTPWTQFDKTVTSSGIQTGIHTSFMDKAFAADLYFIFAKETLSADEELSGNVIRAGLDLILNVKRHAKS